MPAVSSGELLLMGLQCATLALLDYNSVVYPNSSEFRLAEAAYWSEIQAEVKPFCVYKPSNPVGVSIIVLLSRLTQCPFAVKSGGHAAFAGASNIEGGITINLINLDEITLSDDKTVAKIGPGNVWLDVYDSLQPYSLTVIGGRVSAIGIGGLTLGGGISFFSGKYGWACDNVANFEVSVGCTLFLEPLLIICRS
jgi:FAD/FMN-containing dehydrogenase